MLLGCALLAPAAAQDADPVPSGSGLLTTSPFDLLYPAVYRAGARTRVWVRDSLAPADSAGDLDRVDLIWSRALLETDGDLDRALFATLMAVFEHRTIPFTFGLVLPLTLEPDDQFKIRYARLPSHLFADRPSGGDQDKLQHFFASAWLAHMVDNRSMADVSGWGIEIGEALFIRGGANDPRDMRANRLGQDFAALLRIYPDATPSAMFRAWNREYGRRGQRE
jgi:hypothetical protein